MIEGSRRQTKQLLFVTGVPSDTPASHVAHFFGQFGPIDSVEILHTSTNTRAFIICPSTAKISQQICAFEGGLLFKGRRLQVQRFLTGDSLAARVAHMNKRRILARKIPGGMPAGFFREWLEMFFGPVEVLYSFRTDKAHLRVFDDQRRQKTYSILFKDRESAARLLHLATFSFGHASEASIFEKFNAKKRKKASSTVNRGLAYPSEELARPSVGLEREINLGLQPYEKSKTLPLLKTFQIGVLHEVKPTCRAYFGHPLRLCEDWDSSNLKFNQKNWCLRMLHR